MSGTNKENKVNENGFGYSSKKVWSVPPKCVLVCKNKITGHTYSKGKGLQINLPFVRAKLIDVTSRTDGIGDNDKVTNKCLDGFEVTVNPAITTCIVDAVKYEFNSKNPETELRVKLQQVLRKLIANRTYEDLNGLSVNLGDSSYQFLRNEFMDIEVNYGLKLEKIYIQDVEQSKSMKDDYEKKVMQEKENERKLLEAENKKKVAELEAEAEKLKLAAFVEVATDLATRLKKRGLSYQEVANLLHAYIGTRGENDTKIVTLGNNDSSVVGAATAGTVLKKNK